MMTSRQLDPRTSCDPLARTAFLASIAVVLAACDAGGTSDRSGSGGDGGGNGSTSEAQGTGVTTGNAATTSSGAGGGGPVQSNGYYVKGNKIYKQSDNSVHVFHGLDRPSLEWNVSGE